MSVFINVPNAANVNQKSTWWWSCMKMIDRWNVHTFFFKLLTFAADHFLLCGSGSCSVNELWNTLVCAIMDTGRNQLLRMHYNVTMQHICQPRSCHTNSAKEL